MKVKRIIANIAASDPAAADSFYRDILGLELVMDHGWIRTYAGSADMTVQVSVASEGGSGTAVPDLSVEVDDLDEVLRRVNAANLPIDMAQPASRGACVGSTSAIRWAGWSTSCSMRERGRKTGSTGLPFCTTLVQ
jgi:catechol 2,3-dioxygenase-like lactoylglutathione lyase family enzyme